VCPHITFKNAIFGQTYGKILRIFRLSEKCILIGFRKRQKEEQGQYLVAN
jgi:hypothetical protein